MNTDEARDAAAGPRNGLATAVWRVEEASLALVEMTLNAVAEDSDLSVTQLRVLLAVDRHGPLNLSALAAHLAMSVSAAGRLVARLDDAGLLTRLLAPHSRREISIGVTEAGRRAIGRLRAARRRRIAAALTRLPPGTRQALAGALTEFTAAARTGEEPGGGAARDPGDGTAQDPGDGAARDPGGGAARDPLPPPEDAAGYASDPTRTDRTTRRNQ
ncbi:MarR family winged helix-turn-helix transcriptional regulator [Streptosporangium sp. NPDC004379]|uniref:MarR family winged helix-turn-helix transcriptional regulator n=1 Tax=Streptosporangium sp. NPDC004379 TaxID=3366189 RepID=UPI003681EF7C